MQFGLYLHFLHQKALGARGGVIVGTHPLVSTPSGSTKPTSDLARYCLRESSTEFTQ